MKAVLKKVLYLLNWIGEGIIAFFSDPFFRDNKHFFIVLGVFWALYLTFILAVARAPKMIVCDVCKDIKAKPVFDVNLHVVKTEESKGKVRDRQIITIPIHLCDKCITNFNARLGVFIRTLRDEDQPVPEKGQGPSERPADDHPVVQGKPGG